MVTVFQQPITDRFMKQWSSKRVGDWLLKNGHYFFVWINASNLGLCKLKNEI